MFRIKRPFNIQLIKKCFSFAFNAIFPVHCSCCRVTLKVSSVPPYLCKDCFSNITLLKNKNCIRCGKSLDISPASLICPECISGKKFIFKEFFAPLTYSEYGRAIVHNLKFHSTPSAAKTISELIYAKLASNKKLDCIDAFVPAPISKERLAKRTYNQTELICRHLSKKTGKPVVKALKKIKHTVPQSTLSGKDRLTNLDGSIIFNKKCTLPENIAFIDDVYTTGSTVRTCCEILKNNSSKNIYVLCACINTKRCQE